MEGSEIHTKPTAHEGCDAPEGTDDEHNCDGDLAIAFHLEVADEHDG